MRHVFPRPPATIALFAAVVLAALAAAPARSVGAQEGAPAAAAPQPAAAVLAVGEKLPVDLMPQARADAEAGVPRARVYVFWSPGCPVCRRYAAALRTLLDEFDTKATVALVVGNESDEVVDLALADQELRLPVLRDTARRAAERLGIRVSPTAVVVDAGGVLRYRGPIDDDRRARQRDAREYLRPALDAVLTGKTVETPELRPFGSALRP